MAPVPFKAVQIPFRPNAVEALQAAWGPSAFKKRLLKQGSDSWHGGFKWSKGVLASSVDRSLSHSDRLLICKFKVQPKMAPLARRGFEANFAAHSFDGLSHNR